MIKKIINYKKLPYKLNKKMNYLKKIMKMINKILIRKNKINNYKIFLLKLIIK